MKLSIIIPAYNVENYVGTTLISLIRQSDKYFEVILVDDGSTDQTFHIASRLLYEGNIQYKIIKTNNCGVSSARNTGMSIASGEYVMFLDGDDYVADDLVQNILQIIDHVHPDIICWGYNIVGENKSTIRNYFDLYERQECLLSGLQALKKILLDKKMSIWTGSVAYKKNHLENYQLYYTNQCCNGEDQEFAIKAFVTASTVYFFPKVLSYYVQRQGSISHIYNIKRFDAIDAFKRASTFIENLSDDELSNKIACYLKQEYVLENYLSNFSSSLSALQDNLSLRKRTIKLYEDLESHYPGLVKEMNAIMKKYKGVNKRLIIKIKLFQLSPTIYLLILQLKNKLEKSKLLDN